MLQQLALLKGFDLDGLDVTGPDFIHLVVECSKLAYADRETFYGDPEFVDVPIATLLSDAYNDAAPQARRRRTASLELRPGSVEGFGAVVKLRRAEGSARRRRRHGGGRADRRPARRGARRHRAFRHRRPRRQHDLGDAVGRLAAILAGDPRARLLPRHARRRCSGWRRAIRPRSRPASGRAPRCRPTLALRDGEPYLAWGSPGGDQQDQWTTQFFLRHVHAGMNLQEAIDAPAWHSEHFPISFWPRTARPGVLVVESRVPAATRDELKRRGHVVEVGPAWSEGRLTAASRDGRRRRAAANPRGMQGYAAGR